MSSLKFSFSKTTLSGIVCPASGRQYYRDEKTRGLVLDVQASGAKTFQVYRKVCGNPTRVVLGRFDAELPDSREFTKDTDPLSLIGNTPALNVKMARKLADAVNASLDRGENPASTAARTRREAKDELTLREAFEIYHERHLVPEKKRTAEDLRNDFARYLGKVPPGQKKLHGQERKKSAGSVDWENKKLSSITTEDIRTLMIKLQAGTGDRTANKVFVLLRSVFNAVIAWKQFKGENPCAGIKKYKETSRDRFISEAELPRFIEPLLKHPHRNFKDFILLSLFTGARRENVLGMRWSDIDMDIRIWTVPNEVSKNGDPLTISITSITHDILKRRLEEVPRMIEKDGALSNFVFAAKSATGYMSAPQKQWNKFRKDTGIENFRLHDLRRSLGSWAAISGASLPVIGRALGHKSSKTTEIYARLHQDPVMKAMELAANTMLEKGKANPPAAIKAS